MKGKYLLLTILVILAGTAFWLARTDKGTSLSGPLTGFTVADTSKVTRIFIAEPSGATVDLKRTERGWTVNDMDLARPGNVDLVLKTFLRAEVRRISHLQIDDFIFTLETRTSSNNIVGDYCLNPDNQRITARLIIQ